MGILVELFDVDYDIFIQAQVLLFGIFLCILSASRRTA